MIGYGKDTACADTLKPGVLVAGWRLIAEACYRRLITPRGTLRGGDEETNYGIDLAEYVGRMNPELAANALPSLVRGELLKDDRVLSVSASSALSYPNPGDALITLTIDVTTHEETEDFQLTILVSAVTVELLGLEAA